MDKKDIIVQLWGKSKEELYVFFTNRGNEIQDDVKLKALNYRLAEQLKVMIRRERL